MMMNQLKRRGALFVNGPRRRSAPPGGRSGAILGVVLVTLLAASILGLALLTASDTDAIETARQTNRSKAFWTAEAGMNAAVVRLRAVRSYRMNPGPLTGAFGDGSYAVTVTKIGRYFTYHLVSAGTVLGAEATIAQDVTIVSPWHETFMKYGLFGGGNFEDKKDDKMKIDREVLVEGDVFQYGKVEIKHDSTVTNGLVYGTGKISGDGSYNVGSPQVPDPAPAMPSLDTSYYDNEISLADRGGTTTQRVDHLALDGGTLRIDGHLVMRHGGSITGPGTLVVAKEIDLERGVTIGDDVTIIAGRDIRIKKTCTLGANVILYGSKKIEMTEDSTAILGGVFISPGEVKLRRDSVLEGVVIYSGGKAVKIQDGTTLTGAVVSGDKLEIKKGSRLIHDPTTFPETIPIGLEQGMSGWTAIRSNWRGG